MFMELSCMDVFWKCCVWCHLSVNEWKVYLLIYLPTHGHCTHTVIDSRYQSLHCARFLHQRLPVTGFSRLDSAHCRCCLGTNHRLHRLVTVAGVFDYLSLRVRRYDSISNSDPKCLPSSSFSTIVIYRKRMQIREILQHFATSWHTLFHTLPTDLQVELSNFMCLRTLQFGLNSCSWPVDSTCPQPRVTVRGLTSRW